MNHYTLNTGHNRHSPRSEVRDDVIPHMARYLQSGLHEIGDTGYQCYTTVLDATIQGGENRRGILCTIIHDGERACLTFGVVRDDHGAVAVREALEEIYSHYGGETPTFPATPWCAAVLAEATPEEAYWMADFERCLAWAWMEL